MAKRIERIPAAQVRTLVADPTVETKAVMVKVVESTDGPVTWKEKVKKSYKAAVTFVGALVTLLTQVGPITEVLPEKIRVYLGIATVGVTALLTFLVKNQVWVDEL